MSQLPFIVRKSSQEGYVDILRCAGEQETVEYSLRFADLLNNVKANQEFTQGVPYAALLRNAADRDRTLRDFLRQGYGDIFDRIYPDGEPTRLGAAKHWFLSLEPKHRAIVLGVAAAVLIGLIGTSSALLRAAGVFGYRPALTTPQAINQQLDRCLGTGHLLERQPQRDPASVQSFLQDYQAAKDLSQKTSLNDREKRKLDELDRIAQKLRS